MGDSGHSADKITAQQRAVDLLDIAVTRQAMVLAYNHIVMLVRSLFILGPPLMLLLRKGERAADA